MTDTAVHEVKKYPNRRFYDVTARRHASLADLYQLVRKGTQIAVTDSKSGEDITNIVLTQIILEHDPPKMDLFPAPLLHQAIQANQQMVRRFIDEYFAQAMSAFVESGKRFEDFIGRAGLNFMRPPAMDWTRGMFGGMSPTGAAQSAASPTPPHDQAIDSLRSQVQDLQAELARMTSKKAAPRAKAKRGRGRPPRR